MFDRTTRVQQSELVSGMIVKHGRAWVRIHHIEPVGPGANQRKGTCTLRHQTKLGAFTVWFSVGTHKVITGSLPAGFAVMAHTTPPDNSAPPVRENVQGVYATLFTAR